MIILVGGILFLAGLVCHVIADPNYVGLWWLMLVFGTALIVLGSIEIREQAEIKPIDVYQGHTTLQYTIVDGEVTDSTVIWKPEYDEKKK